MNTIATARRCIPATQKALARQLGIAPMYLSQIERGVRKPSRELAGRLAGALGLRLHEVRPDWAENS